MQELLKTLIKEKGLWKEDVYINDGFKVADWGQGVFNIQWPGNCIQENIWHIDTLREIAKAKWGSNYVNECLVVLSWDYHFRNLCSIESPKEREEYLAQN